MTRPDDWHLNEIKIEFNAYGPDEGTYTGNVHFMNGDRESFRFKIRSDMAQRYIDLIADDVVKGAESLGSRLIESLCLTNRSQSGDGG